MRYAELHCLTNFSFLEGASHPDELVAQAAALGYSALAITDRNSVAGVVRAYTATKDHPIKLIIGSEITPSDGPPIILWAKNRRGYANLCALITTGRRRAVKGACDLTVEDIASHTEGLLAGIVPPRHHEDLSFGSLHVYREMFPSSCYLLAEFFRGPHDARRAEWFTELSRTTNIPLAAAGGILYHVPARKLLHDVVTAIRNHTTVAEAGDLLLPNAQAHLRPLEEITATYSQMRGPFKHTMEIADQCTFSLGELKYEYPKELAPAGQTPIEYLKQLTWEGAKQRYPTGIPANVRQTLERELALIEELHYEPFFLTVWDLVRFARSRDILCQGRGSAANSVVCYCLGVTSVDPTRIDVLFERFVSRERAEAPDIDVDFEHERREEVLQYVYEKYGRDRAGITAVTITYRPRSAIRDVGKALGLSLDLVDRIAKSSNHYRTLGDFSQTCKEAGLPPNSAIGKRFIYLVNDLMGFPRHLSQHTGGMVITQGLLHKLVPIENAAMPGRTVVQWNKDDLDDLGILKVDCLALGMLTAIRKCFDLVKQSTGTEYTLANIPEDDSQVYDMICKAGTIGVFQIESRAQMSMLPCLKPRCYYDLVIEVSIVRPGPIQGQMVHPYLRRRNGEEKPTYPNALIQGVLEKTLGVPLFQEQCMQLAIVAAGFSPGEADQLRRAMGAWRRPGAIDQFHTKLINGMVEHGLNTEFAELVFQQIRGFGEYGFPESHAASFALLVYVSAFLKHYHPAAFCAASLNSQPMGFYAPAQLIKNARNHGVKVLPVDINHSDWDCTLEGEAMRLGFRFVKGFSSSLVRVVIEARQGGRFCSFDDFQRRTKLTQLQISALADADAFGSILINRREALWNALAVDVRPKQTTLFDKITNTEPTPQLPMLFEQEQVLSDYRTTGLSLRNHPIAFHRDELQQLGVTPAGELPSIANGTAIKVAGIVLLRQRPGTAKGITFVTLEDETGTTNLVIHPKTWERYRRITKTSQAWIIHGRLESKDSVIHVLVRHVEDISARCRELKVKSRDFR